MKTIHWLGALMVLGTSAVVAVPASALTCWSPSGVTNDFVSDLDSYLDCHGADNHHVEGEGRRGVGLNAKVINAFVYSGSGTHTTTLGYDSSRNFIADCFITRTGNGFSVKQCSTNVAVIAVEVGDN